MKNMARLAGIIALAAVIGFGLAACDDKTDDGNALSEGSYTGAPTGARTATENQILNSTSAGLVLENIESPSFEINSDGIVMPMFGSGTNSFLITVVGGSIQYRFVQAADNSLTLQFNNTTGWTDWNGSYNADVTSGSTTIKKTITGSINPSNGKVTLELRYTVGADYTARTYEFTKQ